MILNIHLIFGTKKELVKELLRFVNVIIGSLAISETTFLFDQIFNSDRIEIYFFFVNLAIFFSNQTTMERKPKFIKKTSMLTLNVHSKFEMELPYEKNRRTYRYTHQ